MRLLLDQGLPRGTAEILRNQGQDCVHVSELGMSTAEDVAIINLAEAERRIVVTFDADFHGLLASLHAVQPSVVRVRIEGLKAEAAAALIQRVCETFSNALERGCVVTVLAHSMRMHRLPL
jgi:predicted nuclease of predicted toxin-antitoxin system